MLYLNPPFYMINGVTLFCDHADPLQYYYLPMAPKLTMINDKSFGKRIPQLNFIKYRGKAGTGGFLNFDVNIGVEQKDLNNIADELKSMAHLRGTPRLAPAPLVDGTVRMMLFGRQTGDQPAADAAGPKFVLKIDQHAKPALYGDNAAAFSVALDEAGAITLEQALHGEMSPIGIVYSLDYLALRPAYSISLKIDWDRVQKQLDEQFGYSGLFASVEIDKAVDKLIEKRLIVMEVDTFVPEGEDSSGIISRRDQAVNEVREMITNAFFEASINPTKPAKDGWDKAAHLLERATAIAATGGWGAVVGTFSYKKTNYTRIDRKTLNVNMRERTTVKRTINPQGHLSGLLRIIQEEKLDINRFIIPVDLDDPWFMRRRVSVISRGNFEDDSIGSLNVNLKYGSEPKNVILEASTARAEMDWPSIIRNGTMARDVKAKYKVNFKGVDSTKRPIALESPEQTVTVENLEINPRELYSILPVPILALNFPWDRYPYVEVQTHYSDEANGIQLKDNFVLNKDKTEQLWKMFVRGQQSRRFRYKLVYRAANNKDVEMPWVDSDVEQIVVRDPYPQKRTLQIVPDFSWADVDRAFLDVAYRDPDNNVLEERSFEFNQADAATKTFVVDLVNPNRRLVEYSATIIYKDGHVVTIPRSFTFDRRIIVRADMKGHKVILVRAEPVDFAAKKVKSLTVELHHKDSLGDFSDVFSLKSASDRGQFEFDYSDETKAKYEYRASYAFTNGLSRTTDWKAASIEELVVPVA